MRFNKILLLLALVVSCKQGGGSEVLYNQDVVKNNPVRYEKFLKVLKVCLKDGVEAKECMQSMNPSVVLPLDLPDAQKARLAAAFTQAPTQIACDKDKQACKLIMNRNIDAKEPILALSMNPGAELDKLFFDKDTFQIKMRLTGDSEVPQIIEICQMVGVSALKLGKTATVEHAEFRYDEAGKLMREDAVTVGVYIGASHESTSNCNF